jgi:ATP-dependent RNA helicase DDX60
MLCTEADTTPCSTFLLHALIIKHLSLSQRRLPFIKFDRLLDSSSDWYGGSESESGAESGSDGDFDRDIIQFLAAFAEIAVKSLVDKKLAGVMLTNAVKCDLTDLTDGRLFRIILQASIQGSLETALPLAVRNDWYLVSEIVLATCGNTLSLDPVQGLLEAHEFWRSNW